jgi:hypothetical protein
VAVPEWSGAVPNEVFPLRNVTVPPVGVPLLGAVVVTVAVKISVWPYVIGAVDTRKDVKVAALRS